MSKAKKRPRAAARQGGRTLEKLGQKLDRLVLEAPGGSRDKAIAVSSASVVEVKARTFRCARCEGELLLLSHEAEFLGTTQLRRAEMQCRACFVRRRVWFSLGPGPIN